MFLSSEAPAVVVTGFPDQFVTLSLHEVSSDRVLYQTTQFVTARKWRGVTLEPLRPGHYIARVSQEGVRKAESMFVVR